MRYRALASVITSLLLAACGGQDTEQHPSRASKAAQRIANEPVTAEQAPEIRLDSALTNEQADAARRTSRAPLRPRSGAATLPPLVIDTSDREAVRLFYRVFLQSNNVPMGWTGDYASGKAGTTSDAYRDATLLRINWYRAMAGVPADIVLDPELNAMGQEAALMMSANGTLNHFPPPNWLMYTEGGARAAGNSNLSLGEAGADAVTGQMRDPGSSNAPAGHRRWLLYPGTRTMGTGNVPGDRIRGLMASNSVWVLDSAPRSTSGMRDDGVAWPVRGYNPYQTVYGRWSFSYPQGDFSAAQVRMTRNGVEIPVTIDSATHRYGDPTIVWRPESVSDSYVWTKPSADEHYEVTINNVRFNGIARSFTYPVIVFDPGMAGPGTAPVRLKTPALLQPGEPAAVKAESAVAGTGYEVAVFRNNGPLASDALAKADSWRFDGDSRIKPFQPGFFHLYHAIYEESSLALESAVLPGAGSVLEFDRSTGYATQDEVLSVQVDAGDGRGWSDIYSETGASHTSSHVTVPLKAYAGRVVKLRLALNKILNGRYYTCGLDCGWRLSRLTMNDVSAVRPEGSFALDANGDGTMQSQIPGELLLSTRQQFQQRYYGDAGTLTRVKVDGAVLTGPRSNYTITQSGGVYTIRDNTGKDGVQTVQNVKRLHFKDVILALDIQGVPADAFRLYQAAFDRKPDLPGLGFWIGAMDRGTPLLEVANAFVASPEFKTMLGSNVSNEAVLRKLYQNVLHRQPDTPGFNYWMGRMNSGTPLALVLLEFSTSKENVAQVAGSIASGVEYIPYQ